MRRKEIKVMVLFTIILLIFLLLLGIIILFVGAFGTGVIVVFGDVIVCLILLIWIGKKLIFKNKD
jgi:hypothetical protein